MTKAASDALSPEAKRGVFVVWLIIFIDLLGFGIVLPSLAYFVHLYPIPEWAVRLGRAAGVPDTRAVFVGLLQTAYSLFQFVFAPLWGGLSDRIGRRPVLLASLGGFALAWALFAFAPSLAWLIAARALAGAMGANISTAQAYMADVFPKEKRAKGMGLIGMAFGLGFVFGPALGAVLVSDELLTRIAASPDEIEVLRLRVPSLFSAGLSGLAFAVGLLRLRESLPPSERASASSSPRFTELVSALSAPHLGTMLAVYFVVVLGFSGLETMFSEFNLQHLGLAASVNGLVFTAIGLTMAVVQGGLIGPLSARLGPPRLLVFGLAALTVAMAVFGLQTHLNPGLSPVAVVVLSSIAVGAAFSVCNPSVLGIISTLAKKGAQGETMGVTSSAATLGRIAGPLIGGVVYARVGPEWPFIVGGALVGLALLLLLARLGALDAALR